MPLPVQKEIVDTLDKFTKLEAEMEAEWEPDQLSNGKGLEYK